MIRWGKLIGAMLGFVLTGSLLGAIIGFFLGSLFEQKSSTGRQFPWGPQTLRQNTTQQTFFKVTFLVIGHVAKADGYISTDEIRSTRLIMQRMQLNDDQKHAAIQYFTQGKQANFQLRTVLSELLQACHHNRLLLKMFVDIQYQAAMTDGTISTVKKHILARIYQHLGVAVNFYQSQSSHSNQQRYRQHAQQAMQTSLQQAYALLEIPSNTSNHDVKRAYRKLMSQTHPDKLIARGLPEEMIKLATDKTQKIRAAYDQIRKARKF